MTATAFAPGAVLTSEGLIALRRLAVIRDRPQAQAALPGGFATRRKGPGLEVAEIRDYVPGDDIRHLDRNGTARTGRLHVRQFQEERDRVCLLVADMRRTMFWGLRRALLSTAAAEALALVGWQIVESGGRVGLLVLTDGPALAVPPRGRARGMLDVIGGMTGAHRRALSAALAGQGDAQTLEQGLVRAERLAPTGSEILIASSFDRAGTGLADQLDALARRRFPRLILVTGASELPKGGYPVRLPDGRSLKLQLGTALPSGSSEASVAGHSALVLDAGASIEENARRIFGARMADRTSGRAA